MDTIKPSALDIIADAVGPFTLLDTSPAQVADLIVARLEAAGFIVLDGCARCGEDPRAHWCADLEETFN